MKQGIKIRKTEIKSVLAGKYGKFDKREAYVGQK
jgi:hypothetical protein